MQEINQVLIEGLKYGMDIIIRGGSSECLKAVHMDYNNVHDHIPFRSGFGSQDHDFWH